MARLLPHPRAKALFHDVIVGRLALNAEGLPSPDPSASRLWPSPRVSLEVLCIKRGASGPPEALLRRR